MQFTLKVEEPSKVSRKLTITISAQTVDNWFQKKLVEAQRSAKIKGFRQGHVPVAIVKQYYGDDIRNNVLSSLIDESYDKALKDKKLRPVSRPAIEALEKTAHPIQEGKDFTYSATVEVFPEIEVKTYTGLKISRPKIEIKDEDVENVVKGVLEQQAQLVPLEKERKTKKGDFVDFSFKGGVVTDAGVEPRDGMSGQRVMEIGSNQLIPGFEDEMIGLNKGDSKTFRIKFPAEYGAEDLAGQEAEFAIEIHEIKEKKLPDADDEFFKTMGYEGASDFKTKAKANLLKYKTEEADGKVKSDLLEQLIEKNPFDLPQSLIRAQANLLAQDFAQNLKQQRFNEKMIAEALKAEQETIMKRAESQVRSGLILDWISNKESIQVSDADITDEIKNMASQMGMKEQEITDFYSKNSDKKDGLIFRIKEEKTVRFLLDQAKVK